MHLRIKFVKFQYILPAIACFLGSSGCLQSDATDAKPQADDQGWVLVWADEFDGTQLDRTKWQPETSCWGGGNDERQCYTDRADNIAVEDGYLTLTAQPEIFTGPNFPQDFKDRGEQIKQNYTSGKVRTLGRQSWTYGRFEARIRVPQGQSAWSAFWMLPQNNTYGKWPLSGEIDIMEAVNLGAICDDCGARNSETRSIGALHFGQAWPQNKYLTGQYDLGAETFDPEAFYSFAVEWGEGKINWFVDGNLYFSMDQSQWNTDGVEKTDRPAAPFDQPFYVMLNLAVGGNLPDNRNEKTFNPKSFPAQMQVDWVRVYQCNDDKETGRKCMRD